jgi:hypothetical protein
VDEHPTLPGIMLHSDEELGKLLGVAVKGRKTVHEWPRSCVQGVRLVDGTPLAYKSQLPPTVEPEFYAAADSPLLPAHRNLGALGDCTTMTLEWVSAPKLRKLTKDPDELAGHARRVVAEIAKIGGDLPVHLDISTPDRWDAVTGTALRWLRTLVADHRFGGTDAAVVDRAAAWAQLPRVRAAVTAEPVVAHGDLTVDQVFLGDDGYRVIDWQRPVRGPGGIDVASLLSGRKIDPAGYVDATAIQLFWFLRLYWAVEAQHELFPEQSFPLFEQWAAQAVEHLDPTS